MLNLELKHYAYIGDAVWDLYVRERVVEQTPNPKELHKKTIELVNAKYQHELLLFLEDELIESELDLLRRGRNLSIPISRRSVQSDYRMATAFEVLIGWWYINDKCRLEEIKEKLKKYL